MQALEIERSPLVVCVDHLQQTAGPAANNENAVALATKLLTAGTLQSCARTIQQDFGLTLRLLRIANSAMFNLSGKTVISVTHATALMGTDALSQLVDTVPRYVIPRPVRDLVLLSHLSAAIARNLMNRLEPRYAEEAFIAGLFRNIGEICYAQEQPEDYIKILRGSQGHLTGLRASCRTHAKFDFDELTAGLLQHWSLHGSPVMAAQSTPEALLIQHGNPEADVALAASLGHLITVATWRCELNEREKVMRACWPALAKQFQIREQQLPELCFSALDATHGIMNQMGIKKDELRLKEWMPPAEEIPVPDAHAVRLPEGATMVSALQSALALGVDRVAWLPYFEPEVQLGNSAGAWTHVETELLPKVIHPRKPTFLLAFGQRQDVWIDFSKDDRFRATPLAERLSPLVYFLLPVCEGRKVRGCLYFDWITRRDFPPETLLPALSAFRDAMAMNMPAA